VEYRARLRIYRALVRIYRALLRISKAKEDHILSKLSPRCTKPNVSVEGRLVSCRCVASHSSKDPSLTFECNTLRCASGNACCRCVAGALQVRFRCVAAHSSKDLKCCHSIPDARLIFFLQVCCRCFATVLQVYCGTFIKGSNI